MFQFDYQPAVSGKTFSEYDYLRKYQSADTAQTFKSARREMRYAGLTVNEMMGDRWSNPNIVSEAIQTLGDNPSHWLPDVILADVLEGTRYGGYARTIANVYPAPAGQPLLYYRKFERFVEPQIVGETDEIKSKSGEKSVESLAFWTIGDRVINSWQSVKDSALDQMSLDLRAMGAMFSLTEDAFVVNALYGATSGANAATYNNAVDYYSADLSIPFQDLLLWKARMGAPTATSHPDVPALVRRSLLNLYNANVCIVPPAVYESLVASQTNNASLMDQTFWRNSEILDTGAIRTFGGMTIYRFGCGYWTDGTPLSDWTESNDVYLIDTRLGGVDLVQKEALQTVNWDTYERRINNLLIYERLNAVVRNPRSVMRLHVSDEYGA